MHQFVVDGRGNLFVNVGSASNACEAQMGEKPAMGHAPCAEVLTRAGIWRFDAGRPGQRFTPEARYATGIRNISGMRIDPSGALVVSQHGRDLLRQNWPKFFSVEQGAELPAEELLRVEQGDDFGWPTCYFDGKRGALMLAPEYGGDGKTIGACAGKKPPVATYPAHWAPNDLLFYAGKQFPGGYRDGVFLAFHGSWNRAPLPQAGFRVVFQPLRDGKASGEPVLFADGFAGAATPGRAARRPAGLAEGPDGALYVSDDNRGRIWRITYTGAADAPVRAAPRARYGQVKAATAARLTPPSGYSEQEAALGMRIFNGQEGGGTCSGCHGANAKGGTMGPPLATGKWLWTNGSPEAIAGIVRKGVASPRKYGAGMPPLGGADLSESDVRALSAYVWAVSHRMD